MNELELAQFAVPAAQALLAAMVSDSWGAIKARFARIIAGRSGNTDATENDLDELRRRIISEQESGDSQQGQNAIFALICTTAARNPEAITPLKELLSDINSGKFSVQAQSISQDATVRDSGVAFQQVSGTQNYRPK